MRTHTLTPLRAALAAVLLVAAAGAHAQMYRWTDANGSVNFSDKPPSETALVKDLTVVLDEPGTLVDRRAPAATASQGDSARGAAGAAEASPSAPPRISIAPSAPEAVRDPCLRSADPKCHERNRDAYVPYRGYSPSAARSAKEMGVGATSSAGAGGTLSGGSPAPGPAKLEPPKASLYALPPGTDLPPVATTSTVTKKR